VQDKASKVAAISRQALNYINTNIQTYLIIDVRPKDSASKYPSQLTEPERCNKNGTNVLGFYVNWLIRS